MQDNTTLCAVVLFICLCIVGAMEKQDVELAQQLAAEHQPVRMAKR
jgi:hypothetical protein